MTSFLGKSPWGVALLLLTSMSCGGGGDDTSSSKACTPGVQVKCACGGGLDGAQACKDDGSGFEACTCDNSNSSSGGSTSGKGGTSGSSTSGKGGTTNTSGSGSGQGKIQACRNASECSGGLKCVIAFGADGDNVGVCAKSCLDGAVDCAANESCIQGSIGGEGGPLVCIPNCSASDPCGSPTLKCAERFLFCASAPGGQICVPQAWKDSSFNEWETTCE